MREKIKFLMMLLVLSCTMGYAQSVTPIAEDGKTWWYSYRYYTAPEPSMDTEQIFFGFTINSTTEIDGEQWFNVMYVDGDNHPIVDFPVAYLCEREDGCYVLPGIDTQEKLDAIEAVPGMYGSIGFGNLLPYAGRGFGQTIEEMKEMTEINGPVLLYPHTLEADDKMSYPWMRFYEANEEDKKEIGFNVSEIGWYNETLREYRGECRQFCLPNCNGTIVQSVGFIDAKPGLFLFPYIWEDIRLTPDLRPTHHPILEKVTDKNGKVIYRATESDPESPLMVTDSKIWNYTVVYTPSMGEVSTYEHPGFHFGDQKELNGKVYNAFLDGEDRVYAYMRQDGPRVYVAGEGLKILDRNEHELLNRDEYLLYDFSLNPGDRFETLGFDIVGLLEDEEMYGELLIAEVVRTYEKEINGVSYKYLDYDRFAEGTRSMPDYSIITVVEGIGPLTGYLCFPGTDLLVYSGWYDTWDTFLTSVTTKDGGILWDDPSGVESVEADANQSTDGAIFDLYGRRVINPLPGTIYIRDGRKYVAR